MLIDDFCKDLMVNKETVKEVLDKNNLYKCYAIPKKNGKGKRIIKQPSKEIKLIQYWLNDNIINKLPCSKIAMAYEKGCSIIKNAEPHKSNAYILHTDIKNFFPSITKQQIINLLKKQELNLKDSDITFIIKAVMFNDIELTIGSVSAPKLSNRVLFDFDMELCTEVKQFFNDNTFVITRYADDIIISSDNKIENSIIGLIENLLKNYGFEMNKNKTYFMSKNSARKVTGISIDNNFDSLGVGSKYYRRLKREIYNYLIHDNSVDNTKIYSRIMGKLAYVKSVSNEQYLQLKKIYVRYQKKDFILFNE